MSTTATPCLNALNALSELVSDAHTLAYRARLVECPRLARRITNASITLDAARTRLVQDGTEYLDVALAFLDAGRAIIAVYAIRVYRAQIETHRARA